MDAEEPRYVRPGNEFGDEDVDRVPKWRKPRTDFQRAVLRVVHYTSGLWPKDMDRSLLNWYIVDLERGMASLRSGIVAEYPEEWVRNCFEWAEKMNKYRTIIGPLPLKNLICDKVKRDEFIRKWEWKEKNGRADSWN